MAAPKPPITCHVLDTSLGKPASSIPVTLSLLPSSPSSSSSSPSPIALFTSTTNPDGRVTSWTPAALTPFSTPPSIEECFDGKGDEKGNQKWSLRFDTQAYFEGQGKETFFPEVEVRFVVRGEQRGKGGGAGKEHFHVPVLLSQWSYTTYRGS